MEAMYIPVQEVKRKKEGSEARTTVEEETLGHRQS